MSDIRRFIRVHDGIDEHPKVEALSDKAFRHLISLWCHCARNLTNGLVSEAAWTRITNARTARELVASRLARRRDDDTWEMHDYLEHQRSRQEVESLSEKRRLAGRRGGLAKANGLASATAPATPLAKQTSTREEKRREVPPLPPAASPSPPSPETPSADAEEARDDPFGTFWETYPRKVSRPAAQAAWARATTTTDPAAILTGLSANLPQLEHADPKFIPHPAKWLTDERWADVTAEADTWAAVPHANPRP